MKLNSSNDAVDQLILDYSDRYEIITITQQLIVANDNLRRELMKVSFSNDRYFLKAADKTFHLN